MLKNGQTRFMFGRVNFHTALFAVIVLANLVVVVVLGAQIKQQYAEIKTAKTDNVQWNFTQLEVNFLRLESEIHKVGLHRTASLEDVRQVFNFAYSRIDYLLIASGRTILANNDQYNQKIEKITKWVDQYVPLIDGPDEDLRAQLSAMEQEIAVIAQSIHEVSQQALDAFAVASDQRREKFASLLTVVTSLSAVLIIAFLIAFFLLLKTYQRANERAQAADQSSKVLQSTISASLDAVLVIDSQSRVIDYNGAAENILGYSRKEVLGKDMSSLIMPEKYREMHRTGMKRFLKTGQKRIVDGGLAQLEAMRKDGTIFPAELSIASASAKSGVIFISFIRDISQRVETEKSLIKARDDALAAEKAKGDFVAVMSHEMRNPLNGLMASLELMSDDPTTEKQSRNLEIAQRTSRQIFSHVSDVLDISKIEANFFELREEVFAPAELIKEITRSNKAPTAMRGNQIRYKLNCSETLTLLADRSRINQILLNLVGNANKFTNEGQISIAVSVKSIADDQVTAIFEISDVGIGIPEDRLEDVFDDFVTLDTSLARTQDGTGLGLSISRRISEQLGGTLSVQSKWGEGSTFTLEVPARTVVQGLDSEAKRQSVAELVRPDLSNNKVLIVEDNPINRSVLHDLLGYYSIQAEEAENGYVATRMAQDYDYDLILMDVSMPVMDGIEATNLIRSQEMDGKRARIAALTAYTNSETKKLCEEAGMDVILHKPVARDDLLNILTGTHTGFVGNANLRVGDFLEKAVFLDLLDVTSAEVIHGRVVQLSVDLHAFLDDLKKGKTDKSTLRDTAHSLAGVVGLFGLQALHIKFNELEMRFCEDYSVNAEEWASLNHCVADSISQATTLLQDIAEVQPDTQH